MTPVQLSELEEMVLANPAFSEQPHNSDGAFAIAKALNTKDIDAPVSKYVNAMGVMAALGALAGATILEKLEAASVKIAPLKWAMYALKSDTGIDIGNPQTTGMLDTLVLAGVLTEAERDALKALGMGKVSLSEQQFGEPVSIQSVLQAMEW